MALSNDILDVGSWTITLQATLDIYPNVPAATAVIDPGVVLHPCE